MTDSTIALIEWLNKLRLKAFKVGTEANRQAYFDALSLAFQRGELIPAPDLTNLLDRCEKAEAQWEHWKSAALKSFFDEEETKRTSTAQIKQLQHEIDFLKGKI